MLLLVVVVVVVVVCVVVVVVVVVVVEEVVAVVSLGGKQFANNSHSPQQLFMKRLGVTITLLLLFPMDFGQHNKIEIAI